MLMWSGCGTDVVRMSGERCGAGTRDQQGACVPSASNATDDGGVACGPGTIEVGGLCIPMPAADGGGGGGGDTYDVRIAIADLPADGYSGIPVLAIGRHADGTPATDQVVFNTSRPGAGTFQPATAVLGLLGATSMFTPCSGATPGCAGPVDITLSLASDPGTPVAVAHVNLMKPMGVGSAAPCLVGGNVLYFNGNDYIYNGMLTVTQGRFQVSNPAPDNISLWITPSGQNQGLWWDLTFSSHQLGKPLAEQVYTDAERAPFASPNHPGIDIEGDGRGCNTIGGKFQIEKINYSGNALVEFTASFEQHCEGGPNSLRGCVHYHQ
jgi:hypothetical protein